MPRKGHIAKREVDADPVYNSSLVTKFVNSMMWDGKKSTAQGIFYQAMTNLEQKGGDEALKLFKKAVENCKPLLEVKTRRVGGANYQVPIEVNPERRTSLAIRWLVTYGRARGEKGMIDKLTSELLDAANGRGAAMKKKEDVHRMAEANKAARRIASLTSRARVREHRASSSTTRSLSEYRNHGAHRRRQDHYDGTDFVLHRDHPSHRRSA
jgi:small subunit ribosomal protein S7